MSIIFFDLDDTLYDRSLPFIRAFHVFFEGKHPERAKTAAAACMLHSIKTQADAEAGRISAEQMVVNRFRGGMADAGITISAADALRFNEQYEEAQRQISLSDTMRHCLDLCGSNFDRTGIMTNGVSEKQRWKISLLGMERWVDPELIIVSSECGILKPNMGVYLLAQKLTGLSGSELTLVGDSYESDLRSAIELGWHTIWLNRKAAALPEDAPSPEYEVRDEEAFAALLEDMCRNNTCLGNEA